MSNIKIMHDNYFTGADDSSLQARFPVRNLLPSVRRSKVWRSAGFWNTPSGSNALVIREEGGIDLIATLADTAYESTDDLMTALEVALNAIGQSGYLVTQDLSGKIKITAVLAGTADRFEVRTTNVLGINLAGNLGFDTSSDLTGSLVYTASTLKISTGEALYIDLGVSSNPRAFVLVGVRDTPIKFTPEAVVKLQANHTNAWSAPAFETTLTYDSDSMSLFSSTGLAADFYRFWRISIDDTSNPLGYVEVSKIFLGDVFEPTRGSVQFSLPVTPQDFTTNVVSESGHIFSDIRNKTNRFNLSWFGLTASEKEQLEDIFNDVGTGLPLFISLDPNVAFGSSVSRHLKYVRFANEPTFELVSPGVFTAKTDYREEL